MITITTTTIIFLLIKIFKIEVIKMINNYDYYVRKAIK